MTKKGRRIRAGKTKPSLRQGLMILEGKKRSPVQAQEGAPSVDGARARRRRSYTW